jgi:hypothetical protein
MERKAVFDHNGQRVGWILLDFEVDGYQFDLDGSLFDPSQSETF